MILNYSSKTIARIAGLFYLIVVLTGIFSLLYVPKTLFIWNNPTLTFNKILHNELLFRTGIFSSVICYTAFLFLPIILYKLLKQVNEFYSLLMTILAIVSVPVSFMNLQHKFSILSLIGNEKYLKIYSNDQLQSNVMFYLNQYDNGILLVSIFWGLWLLPFGYLLYKSEFIPKILGILLILGCFGYLTNFAGNILITNYAQTGISKFVSLPGSIGEIGTCLWLLIVGVKNKKQ
jgi:hypothetical protein